MRKATNAGRNISEYIQHLEKAREKIEGRQDELMGPVPKPPFDEEVVKLEAEFITLGTVIRDLELVNSIQAFSYWDA